MDLRFGPVGGYGGPLGLDRCHHVGGVTAPCDEKEDAVQKQRAEHDQEGVFEPLGGARGDFLVGRDKYLRAAECVGDEAEQQRRGALGGLTQEGANALRPAPSVSEAVSSVRRSLS